LDYVIDIEAFINVQWNALPYNQSS
jgi:hypothetical protein